MNSFKWSRWLLITTSAMVGVTHAVEPEKTLRTAVIDGRVEAKLNDLLLFAWQVAPIKNPIGGEKFSGSAFFHSLSTPSGFCWTQIQPDDHKHHFGLWWPWKFIGIDEKPFNTWEIQEGQGAHEAVGTKTLSSGPNEAEWEFQNQTVIKRPGQPSTVVIHETTRAKLFLTHDTQTLDFTIHQRAAGPPVTVLAYRYSGFSWRGPASWNKDNSVMTTDSGKNRDQANGTPSRWVMVSGPSPKGSVTVLMMTAAKTPEKLRVWDSNAQSGAPFVNFNPVMDHPLPLDEAHPEVSLRHYRVIAADRTLSPAEAESEWQKWAKKSPN